MPLVLDFKRDFVPTRFTFAWTELLLGPEERVLGFQSQEAHGVGDSVSEVGFHFDVASLANLSLGRSIAYDTGSLSEVRFIGDDLDAPSFSDCDFAGEASEIDADGCHYLLLVHINFKMRCHYLNLSHRKFQNLPEYL